MFRKIYGWVFITLLISLTACSGAKSDLATPTVLPIQTGLAGVSQVQVSAIDAETGQAMLLVSGVLSSSCEKVGEIVSEQSGNAFKITILTEKTAEANCQSGELPFSQAINLDIQDLEPGKYPVIVNGTSTSLEISPLPQPVQAPTPAPTDTATTETNLAQDQTSGSQSPEAEPPAVVDSGNTQPAENPASQTSEQGSAPSAGAGDQTAVSLPDPGQNQDDCIDKAAFYEDVTIPDNTVFQAGDEFTKTWKVRNEGTCTWGSGYALVFGGGDQMDGALSNPIPIVSPQETVDISIRLKAPARGGQQTGNWEFQNSNGKRFGVGSGGLDYIWVQIIVDWGQPQAQDPAAPAPANPSQPAPSASPPCPASENPGFDGEVLALINNIRVNAGLNPVSLQSQLSSAAREHSFDMACNNFADHDGSDGSTWYDRVGKQGYANYASAKEIIYYGDPNYGGTPSGAVEWWLNSRIHNEIIHNPNVNEIGIAYIYYPSSGYGGYYTVVFARP